MPFERSSAALLHAEAVLFIDHGELQVFELHRAFNDGVGPDDDFDAAVRQSFADRLFLRLGRASH